MCVCLCVTESLCCIRGTNNIANQLYFNKSKLKQLCYRAQFLTTQRGTDDAPGPRGGEDYPGLGEEGLEGASTFTQSNSSLTQSSEDSGFSIRLTTSGAITNLSSVHV